MLHEKQLFLRQLLMLEEIYMSPSVSWFRLAQFNVAQRELSL